MKLIRTIVTSLLAVAAITPAFSYNANGGNPNENCSVDPVVMQLDSMAFSLFKRDKFFVNDAQLQASIDMPASMVPHYSDAEIKEKMKLIPSLIPLNYNASVRQFIEFFGYKRRGLMTRCLANSQIYFPIFEEILDKKGLPMELKYLPIVESAFNPVAISRCGATGLWQLMYGTGSQMGLDINSYVDERRDPVKATEAAVDYLKKLYDMYGDWQLVLAAYNSGPGNVNKAIARAGGVKNFWAISNFLPAETRSYVPTYIAAIYVMNYYQDFKLVSAEPRRELYAVDTVLITSKVSLAHISDVLNIPVDELQFLNPSIKTGVIPFTQNGFALNLPVNYFAMFESKEDEIMNDPSQAIKEFEPIIAGPSKSFYCKVKKNENINTIATKYGVTVASIKKINRLKKNTLYTGQKLKIVRVTPTENSTYTRAFNSSKVGEKTTLTPPTLGPPPTTTEAVDSQTTGAVITDSANSTTQKVSATVKTTPNTKCIYYAVQPGDTLWNIAQRYKGITIDKLRSYNKTVLSRPIRVGDVLKIFL